MLVVLSVVGNHVRFSAATYVDSYYRLQTVLGARRQFCAKSELESQMGSWGSKMRDILEVANAISAVSIRKWV